MMKSKISPVDLFIKIFIGAFALFSIFPFYQTILISLSKEGDKYLNPIYLWPVHIKFSAYTFLFKEGKVVSGILVTLFVIVEHGGYNPCCIRIDKKKYAGS